MDGVSLASPSDTSRVLGGACPAAFFKYRLLERCERTGFRCSYSLLPDRSSVAAVSRRILLTKSLMFSDSSHHVTRQTSGESGTVLSVEEPSVYYTCRFRCSVFSSTEKKMWGSRKSYKNWEKTDIWYLIKQVLHLMSCGNRHQHQVALVDLVT